MISVKIEQNEENIDEIARKTFQTFMKNSLKIAAMLLEGRENEPNFKEKFKELTHEIFEEHLKTLEEYCKF